MINKTKKTYYALVILIIINSVVILLRCILNLISDIHVLNTQYKYEIEGGYLYGKTLEKILYGDIYNLFLLIFLVMIVIVSIISFFKKNKILPIVIMVQYFYLLSLRLWCKFILECFNLYLFLGITVIAVVGLIVVSIMNNKVLLVLLSIGSILQAINLAHNFIYYIRIGHITDIGIIHMMIAYGLNTLLVIFGLCVCRYIISNNKDNVQAGVINN